MRPVDIIRKSATATLSPRRKSTNLIAATPTGVVETTAPRGFSYTHEVQP